MTKTAVVITFLSLCFVALEAKKIDRFQTDESKTKIPGNLKAKKHKKKKKRASSDDDESKSQLHDHIPWIAHFLKIRHFLSRFQGLLSQTEHFPKSTLYLSSNHLINVKIPLTPEYQNIRRRICVKYDRIPD